MTEMTTRRRKRIDAEDVEDERDDRTPWNEEDDDDDPPPRAKARRRPQVVEEDEEDEPLRKSAKSSHRRRDEDDEEEGLDEFAKPSQRKSSKQSDGPIPRKASKEHEVEEFGEETSVPFFEEGWDAVAAQQNNDGGIYFKWADDGEASLVKFLNKGPLAYSVHWVTRQGKQSFPCIGKGCPLCEIGTRSNAKSVFHILNLSVKGGPTVQALEVNGSTAKRLIGLHNDKKTGPLPRLWWAVSRTKGAMSGSIQQYSYSFLPVKDRDLDEDWDISLEDAEAAYSRAEPLDPKKVLGSTNRRVLQEIADEVMDR